MSKEPVIRILPQVVLGSQPRLLPCPQQFSGEAAGARATAQGPHDTRRPAGDVADLSLKALREEAYRTGFEAGMADGRKEGLRAGREEGLAQARDEEYRQRCEEGFQQGLRQGREQGAEEARQDGAKLQADLARQKARLLQLLQSLPAEFARRTAASEDDTVALAHAAVLCILGDAFQSEQGARMTLRRIAADNATQQLIAIRVHPDDAILLSDDAEILALKERGIRWEADREIALGGCFIDTREGTLDARLETQLTAFTQLLLQVRAQTRAAQDREVA